MTAIAHVSQKPRKTLTAATTLTGSDSDYDLFLNSTTEFSVTLMPASELTSPIAITVSGAPSGASYTVVTPGSVNTIAGHIVSSDLNATVDGSASTAADTITFVDGQAVKGDAVYIRSDDTGTGYYVFGHCTAVGGITLTQAS